MRQANSVVAGDLEELLEEALDEPLYEASKKVYPRAVRGFYRRIKWAVLIFALAVYYALPFVRFDRGPNAPSQAVLIDFWHRKFYFFFIELWAQEVYYVAGLLILAALTLFLMTALAGRVWCGYMCPQTVWTDLFMLVERWIEGDRRERIKRDAGAKNLSWWGLKLFKHIIWLGIAMGTGGAWVLYFADAPSLIVSLAKMQAPSAAYTAIGILTFTTYTLAGFMREQVCLYMCPWPRIQAALTDEHALNVAYNHARGEPRVSLKKAQYVDKSGDCIDCGYCVEACPTGVDIRQGANMGCIQCGLCIDACDSVMTKISRPTRLIAYNTDVNIKNRARGKPPAYRLVRPRTVLYAGVIALVGSLMLYGIITRPLAMIDVVHDRNPLFVLLSSGAIHNGYDVHIANRTHQSSTFRLHVEGMRGVQLYIIGATEQDPTRLSVAPDQTEDFRVLLTMTNPPATSATPVTFVLTNTQGHVLARVGDFFRADGP